MSIEDVVDILSVPFIGAVPDDEEVVVATNKGEPLVGKNNMAGQAYQDICRRITGEKVPYMDFEEGSNIWKKISGIFKHH